MHRKKLKLALVESEKTHWQAALETNELLPTALRLTEHDITRIVTGRKTPGSEQAEALAVVLGCNVTDLFPELAEGGGIVNAATQSAVTTLLVADPSVPSDCIPLVFDILNGKTHAPTSSGQPVRLITIKEAAKRFGCTTRTVQRWVSTGEIKFVRRGRLVRIPETELVV